MEQKKQIILLAGPTASGKSQLAIKLANHLDTKGLRKEADTLDKIIKEAQLIAERKLIESREDIQNTILMQKQADKQMSVGDVQGASDTQKKELETRKLLQMRK